MLKMFSTVALATAMLFTSHANAAFVESNLNSLGTAGFTTGINAVNYDTESRLGWLDLRFTSGMSYNAVLNMLATDVRFAGFRLPTLEEHQTMLSRAFPSLLTATGFYDNWAGGHYGPYVNTTESAQFRNLFNSAGWNVGRAYGLVYDAPSNTYHWSGSNPWDAGQVGYSNSYAEAGGRLMTNPNANPLGSEWNWYLVAKGGVDAQGAFFVQSNIADVAAPAALGVLSTLMLLGARRRRVR